MGGSTGPSFTYRDGPCSNLAVLDTDVGEGDRGVWDKWDLLALTTGGRAILFSKFGRLFRTGDFSVFYVVGGPLEVGGCSAPE